MFYCVVKKIQVDFEKNTSLHSSIPETLEENTASYTKYADCLYLKPFAFPSMIWHIFFGILLLICWTNWKGKHTTHTIIRGLISLTCTVGKLEATQLFTLLHHLKPPISDAAGWWHMDEVCLFLILYFDMSLLCIFVTGSGFFSCFLILFLQHWSFTDWNWSHSGAASRGFSLMLSDGKSHPVPLPWRGTDGVALSQKPRLATPFCLKFFQVTLALAKVVDWWLHISAALRLCF